MRLSRWFLLGGAAIWPLALSACGPVEQLPPSAQALSENLCFSGVFGVDVANYQDSPTWTTAASSGGVVFTYIQTNDGSYVDPDFATDWANSKAAGLIHGAYQFFHPGDDPTSQANQFINAVNSVGGLQPGDLPPAMDWEVTDGVSAAQNIANAQTWLNIVQAAFGRTPVIYTYPDYFPETPPSSFTQYPLWIADPDYCPPRLPSPWTTFAILQYGQASVAGVPGGPVDVDMFNGNAAALASFTQGTSCTAPETSPSSVLTGPCGGGNPTAPAPSACGQLNGGEGLALGQSLLSCDGRFQLTLQTVGNVVLYAPGAALWDTMSSSNEGGYLLLMQTDGNLVLYNQPGCAIWASDTGGNPGAFLAVQNDGNAVIYTSGGKALWASGTGGVAPKPPNCGAIPSGYGLSLGEQLESCQQCFTLFMQSVGNLVMYQNGGSAIWAESTSNTSGGYKLTMQTDGNLTVTSVNGCPVWASGTSGHPGASLAVQDDGNLVIYDNGTAIWASGSVACSGGCSCVPPPPPPPPPPDAGPPPASPTLGTAAVRADGTLEVFALGTDNALWAAGQDAGGWSSWTSLGGVVSNPTAQRNFDGRMEVFGVGTNNALWHSAELTPGGSWSPWSSLEGSVTTALVERNTDGRLEALALGTDGALWDAFQTTAGGAWSSWTSLGGSWSSPAVMRNADGRLEAFAVGSDLAIWHTWQLSAGGSWGPWASMGGIYGTPAVARNADGRLELFAVGTDTALWHTWQVDAGGGWSGWDSLGGGVSYPAIGRNADGRLEAFAIGSDSAVWHNWQVDAGGGWSGWNSLGGTANGPTVQRDANGALDVFVANASNAVYHIWQETPGGGWSSWTSLGGTLANLPMAPCDDETDPLPVLDAGVGDGGPVDAGVDGGEARDGGPTGVSDGGHTTAALGRGCHCASVDGITLVPWLALLAAFGASRRRAR